ncbi:MAG: Uma2 family endonuclease [Oscillospiraceae bacterium]|nr:Uma2 family endonuclease [Oscillospiraceae bacterium]
MQDNLARKKKYHTFEDYLSWDDGQRWELVDGQAYAMAAPSPEHQRISGILHHRMFSYFAGKTCEVFAAPFGVRLFLDKKWHEKEAVFQPDLTVVCDPSQLDEHGCNGAPTLVVEILSISTSSFDCIVKLNRYKKAGVREYWIVDPDNKIVHRCMLQEEHDEPTVFRFDDMLTSKIFPGLEIALSDIFPTTEG